ncbi:MAG: pyruvate, phosphate dikinase [Acidobacteria bacterium RIFCSPLOWO2_02_FULL_61_28]|nr:MAG: pyruvate, phosphate dikinase [Acidobacteria bacterium RIFCSPLOWO2_02_FULL_61_28]
MSEKIIYFFAQGHADGNGAMKEELGGKGAGLAEMTNAGLPVPPGFTISTRACRIYFENQGKLPPELEEESRQAVLRLEQVTGQKLGARENPLLVSVRSGGKFSMPGMMDTVLNLGLNDQTVKTLAAKSSNPRFAMDCYRRFIQMFGNVVLEIAKGDFEHLFERAKKKRKVRYDTDLDAAALEEVIRDYKKLVERKTGSPFPQEAWKQLTMARDAVFGSWNNPRAIHYRRMNQISETLGTAVNVQTMVFGNLGETSGTGVGFTRNPSTGEREFYGEFLMNAQGEDVVSGIRTPVPIEQLKSILPEVYRELRKMTERLERHYKDMQDFEFTIQEGKLYMLQTRNGKRTGKAAVKVAVDMVAEGLLTKREALLRVEPSQLDQLLHPVLDESKPVKVIAHGLPASPGAAVGQVVFNAEDAVHHAKKHPVILVRPETVPDDIHGMEVAAGILTSRGGMTSHAAVVARGMGKCCVAGAGAIQVDEKKKQMSVDKLTLNEGDWISLDGSTGRVILGKVPTMDPDPSSGDFSKFMSWADEFRRLGVRANADIPRDAVVARRYGAEGIGLCRTEHMFFAEDRIHHMQAMILAHAEKDRRKALAKLLPMQRKDFAGLFRVMEGLPVIIRLLDPPLHEFLPRREELMVEVALLREKNPRSRKLAEKERLLARVEQLHELNPMLGLRGCRLGILYPEISEMQCRAIFEAACHVAKEGKKVIPEIMIPLAGTRREITLQKQIADQVAEEVFAKQRLRVDYMVGTMIELPRAALVADEIAAEAEFFSFGTNDLTQTTYGFSRDDSGKFLEAYVRQGVLENDPFAVLDRNGVGELIRIATERGRRARPDLEVGICGEHGGDPSSVEFCHQVGLDYVSCSPYRVPIARLAAAQAALGDKGEELKRTA